MVESSGPGYGPGDGTGSSGPGYGWYPPPPPPPPPPRRGGRGILSHLSVAVLAAAVAVGVTLALDHPSTPVNASAASNPGVPGSSAVPSPPSSSQAVPSPVPSSSSSSSSSSSGGTGIQSVVNKVEPGIVIINSAIQYQSEAGAGTGMVVNSDGLVLTNNHVIEDSTKLTATVVATGKTYQATVVGYDTTGDVALIKLQDASGLTTVPLGNSSTVKTGAPVVALGNAEGQGTILPAAGTITGVNQSVTASDQGGTITTETLHGMLETNAGIVSGDSGGPLSNASGQVIGMDTAGQSGSANLGEQSTSTGFAIPINTALSVASQIASGKASSTVSIGYPPFIGIYVAQGTSSNPQTQAQEQSGSSGGDPFGGFGGFQQPGCYTSNADLQIPSQIAPVNSGSLIDGVICGSPAAAAGMTGGAVITAVDGQTVGAPNQLQSILATFRPGDTATITWVSLSGKSTTSTLHLAAGPPL